MANTRRTAGNGRSRAPGPEISATERGSEQIPGTSLMMHRFPRGSLANQPWIGAEGVPVDVVENGHREIASALATWSEDLKLKAGHIGGDANVFDRNAYVPPENIFDQMRMARRAVENDDTVGGLADATEGLAMKKVRWESGAELDDADVFNQWAAQVDLDSFIRACWRELFTHSQYIAARWWGFEDYKVRGNGPPKVDQLTPPGTGIPGDIPPEPIFRPVRDDNGALKKGSSRRKEYKGVYLPLALTLLDSTKVVPLGSLLFGQERLVWTATAEEMQTWMEMQDPENPLSKASDPIMANFFLGKYTPTDAERTMLLRLGVKSPENLLEMNPMYVWRHTVTRPHYKPWADLRLKRIFRWLDMKQQLMAADRVALVGNANYILLVTKGEKDAPASQTELEQLNENFAYVARLPVIIGDHTLNIEIISPKTDYVLDEHKYSVIDARLRESILQTFRAESSNGRGGDTTVTVAKAVARGLENRRHGMKRDFEKNLSRMIYKHPFNDGQFAAEPNLVFSPRNIALDQDQQTIQALIALSARGDISRMTVLEEILDLDEETEAQRREMEALWFDPIFKTATPFNGNSNPMAPDGGPANSGGGNLPPGGGGGGRPPGGGQPKSTPPSPAASTPPRAPRGKNR